MGLRWSWRAYTTDVPTLDLYGQYAVWMGGGWLRSDGEVASWHCDTPLKDVFWMKDLVAAKVLTKLVAGTNATGIYTLIRDTRDIGDVTVQRVFVVNGTEDDK